MTKTCPIVTTKRFRARWDSVGTGGGPCGRKASTLVIEVESGIEHEVCKSHSNVMHRESLGGGLNVISAPVEKSEWLRGLREEYIRKEQS